MDTSGETKRLIVRISGYAMIWAMHCDFSKNSIRVNSYFFYLKLIVQTLRNAKYNGEREINCSTGNY